jgi:UDP-3-O-[3-hydroxymyristoyl] glucosamine N-acyltransferase
VSGDVTFGRGVVVRGSVTVEGPARIEDGAELT